MASDNPILIIGAGIGGLSTAIRLAATGQRVIICEQNSAVGGKMGEFVADGFRWDTGPSVITMRPVFEELFHTAGRRLEEYLTLLPLDPLTRYFYHDGTQLDVTRDWPRLAAQIEALEPRDVEGYLHFLAYAAKLHRLTGPAFLYGDPPSWQRLRQSNPLDALQIEPWLNMGQVIRRYVRSPHLRQLLGRFATYAGASPYQAPATLSVIAHVELTGGVWYPQGGIYQVAAALAQLATELGVEIRLDCPVKQILVQQGRAIGVQLADGSTISGRAVIANVDVTTVEQRLLPQGNEHARPTELSCSGYVLLLGVEREHSALAHHNIFFAEDYRREFADIFQRGVPPIDPTIYVAITSKTDATHAPPGCENWFVLVNVPPVGAHFDWASQEENYRTHIFDCLARQGLEIRPHLRYAKTFTPNDLAQLSGAWRGALYGLSANQALNAFRRPHNRSQTVRGLYFVGGTTHPGGGVPFVILSSKVVAGMVAADQP